MLTEVDRWRERQLDVFQRAQVIDALERQRLLDEYRHAEAVSRMDQENANLSAIGAILADTNAHVGWMEADISRLLAVTERALPVIVEHLALACETLANIATMLASPRETEAQELFKSGTRALATAAEMARNGARGLAEDWFGEAVEDLKRATIVFRQAPETWHNLGLAYASRGQSRDAADAFAACARYAVAKGRAGLAAESVLLAAAELRSIGDVDDGHRLLREYLPLLDRCDELYVSLAIHHGETGLLAPAFKIAPMLAAAVQAKIDEIEEEAASREAAAAAQQAELAAWLAEAAQAAAAEACRAEDGPVTRLRHLEFAVQAVLDAGTGAELDFSADGFAPAALPAELGVAALVFAEVRIYEAVRQARSIAAGARAGLGRLAATANSRQQAVSAAQAARIKELEAEQRRAREAEARQAREANEARKAREAVNSARDMLAQAERALAAQKAQLADAESTILRAEAEVLRLRGVLAAGEAVYDPSRPVNLALTLRVSVPPHAALRPEIEADLRNRARALGNYRRVDLAAGSPAHVLITWGREFMTQAREQYPDSWATGEEEIWAQWALEWGLSADVPLEEVALLWLSIFDERMRDELHWAEDFLYTVQQPAMRARREVETAAAQVERASAELIQNQAAADRAEARRTAVPAEDQRVVRLAQEEIDRAAAQYHAARAAADRAAASMSGVLAELETAIATATRPRDRVVPGARS